MPYRTLCRCSCHPEDHAIRAVGHAKWPALDSEDQDITLSQITSHLWSNYPPSDYFRAPKT
jgi:hypothetical protein